MRISDWSSDVCSSDLLLARLGLVAVAGLADLEGLAGMPDAGASAFDRGSGHLPAQRWPHHFFESASLSRSALSWASAYIFFSRRFSSSSSFIRRSEEHTSELQSLMRISYAVFCLKKKKKHTTS